MNSFTVTAASKEVKLDPKGSATVTFTVTNTTKKPVRGTPKIKTIGSTTDKWLNLPGGGTRNFSPDESQQFLVEISVATERKPGEYAFGLNISNEALPDEDFTEGPAVAFKVDLATEAPPKKPFPWWILIVVGVVLIGGGITIALLLKPSKTTVPEVVRKPVEEASNLLARASLRLEVSQTLATGTNAIGMVIAQDPAPGSKAGKEGVVRLTVERERDKVAVPSLISLPIGRLKELFGSLPLVFNETGKRYDSPQAPGTILEQSPKEGSMVDPGQPISLVVAAAGVEVPDVSSSRTLKVQDAVNRIVGAKLTIGAVNQQTTSMTQQWDRVIGQTPAANSRVAPSTPIVLHVGVRAQRSHVLWLEDIRRVSPKLYQLK